MIHLCKTKVYWEDFWSPVINALLGKAAIFAPTQIDLVISYSQKPKSVVYQLYIFIQQRQIKLIKSDRKYIYSFVVIWKKYLYFKWMILLWTLYLSKNPEKNCHGFRINFRRHNYPVYWAPNQDNLPSDILKDNVTLKNGVIAADHLYHHRNKWYI